LGKLAGCVLVANPNVEKLVDVNGVELLRLVNLGILFAFLHFEGGCFAS
jgi:hypothetical protein